MTECLNDPMRDRLPALALGRLDAAEAEPVRLHVATCAACAAELAVLQTSRLVLQAGAPRVDVSAITRGVLAATGAPARAATPRLVVERGGASGAAGAARRPSVWRSRQWLAAAASLLIVASLALPVFDGMRPGPDTDAAVDTGVAAGVDSPTVTPPAGLAVADGISDLTDAELTALLETLEQVEATVALEPTTLRTPVVDTPEGED